MNVAKNRATRREALFGLVILACAFLVVAQLLGAGLVDDSYIFLRYARNVHDGLGTVFNAGDRVEGYTSPLWLALLTPLFRLRNDPAFLALGLGVFCGLLSIAIVTFRRSFLSGLFLATQPAFVFWAFSGLETPLTGALLLLAFLSVTEAKLGRRRLVFGGFCFALLVLTRPEATALLILAIPIVVSHSSVDWRSKARDLASFTLPLVLVGSHLLWRHSYYGAWLPNTYYAKVGIPRSFLLLSGAAYAARTAFGLFPAFTLALFRRSEHRRAIVFVVLVWVATTIWDGGDFFPLFRFIVPLLPLVSLELGQLRLRAGAAIRQWPATVVVALLILGANALTLVGGQWTAARSEVTQAAAWTKVGRTLDAELPRDASMASLVIGGIGYYGRRTTIDMLGLTDWHIAHFGEVAVGGSPGHQRFDSAYILARRPSLIVLPSSGLVGSPQFTGVGWPAYSDGQLLRAAALADLCSNAEARRLYEYRFQLLADGTYLEALYLRSSAR